MQTDPVVRELLRICRRLIDLDMNQGFRARFHNLQRDAHIVWGRASMPVERTMYIGLSIKGLNALTAKLETDGPCETCGRRHLVICPECQVTWCTKCDGDMCRQC